MTTRTEDLAQQFERANDEFIALIERLDDRQWQARCAAEGWTVAAAASHIAWASAALADVIKSVGDGTQAGFTTEMLEQMNAAEAAQTASSTKQEAVAKLRSNGAIAAATIRSLSDADLEKFDVLPESHPGRFYHALPEKVTVRHWIEDVLIDHFREHGSSILAAAYPALSTSKAPALAAS